jgi:hypothetical protein
VPKSAQFAAQFFQKQPHLAVEHHVHFPSPTFEGRGAALSHSRNIAPHRLGRESWFAAVAAPLHKFLTSSASSPVDSALRCRTLLCLSAQGTKRGKPIGRAWVDPKIEDAIRASLASGKGILKTARECGVGSSTVQRVKAGMARRYPGDTFLDPSGPAICR